MLYARLRIVGFWNLNIYVVRFCIHGLKCLMAIVLQRLTTGIMFQLAFQSIGVVYGDVGTSPLYVFASAYALNEIDSSGNSILPTEKDILGVLSLIIYTLTLFPLIKYVFIVLMANDNGNGKYLRRLCLRWLLLYLKYVRSWNDMIAATCRGDVRAVFTYLQARKNKSHFKPGSWRQ